MTTRQKVGWKVIRAGRTSCIVRGMVASKRYLKGVKVVPNKNCGPLCVFIEEYSAERFVDCKPTRTTVKCRYTPSKEIMVWGTGGERSLRELPFNTALADSVTCLE